MTARRLIVILVGLVIVGVLLTGSFVLGARTSGATRGPSTEATHAGRDFMFQVIGVQTPNQGGHTLNLFFHYRYNSGIADGDIPDYTKVRREALDYLNGADMSRNPYWEVLNHELCARLKRDYPIQAISCELQVVGVENPKPHDEPGYRASIETIGDIEPLAVPGPANP
jgi:hypothetical protein